MSAIATGDDASAREGQCEMQLQLQLQLQPCKRQRRGGSPSGKAQVRGVSVVARETEEDVRAPNNASEKASHLLQCDDQKSINTERIPRVAISRRPKRRRDGEDGAAGGENGVSAAKGSALAARQLRLDSRPGTAPAPLRRLPQRAGSVRAALMAAAAAAACRWALRHQQHQPPDLAPIGRIATSKEGGSAAPLYGGSHRSWGKDGSTKDRRFLHRRRRLPSKHKIPVAADRLFSHSSAGAKKGPRFPGVIEDVWDDPTWMHLIQEGGSLPSQHPGVDRRISNTAIRSIRNESASDRPPKDEARTGLAPGRSSCQRDGAPRNASLPFEATNRVLVSCGTVAPMAHENIDLPAISESEGPAPVPVKPPSDFNSVRNASRRDSCCGNSAEEHLSRADPCEFSPQVYLPKHDQSRALCRIPSLARQSDVNFGGETGDIVNVSTTVSTFHDNAKEATSSDTAFAWHPAATALTECTPAWTWTQTRFVHDLQLTGPWNRDGTRRKFAVKSLNSFVSKPGDSAVAFDYANYGSHKGNATADAKEQPETIWPVKNGPPMLPGHPHGVDEAASTHVARKESEKRTIGDPWRSSMRKVDEDEDSAGRVAWGHVTWRWQMRSLEKSSGSGIPAQFHITVNTGRNSKIWEDRTLLTVMKDDDRAPTRFRYLYTREPLFPGLEQINRDDTRPVQDHRLPSDSRVSLGVLSKEFRTIRRKPNKGISTVVIQKAAKPLPIALRGMLSSTRRVLTITVKLTYEHLAPMARLLLAMKRSIEGTHLVPRRLRSWIRRARAKKRLCEQPVE